MNNLEAFKVASVLEVAEYPSLSVVALKDSKMMCIDRIEGIHGLETIISQLNQHVERYNLELYFLRNDKKERDLARQLREQQDAAYQASLQADRVKEIKAKEIREAEKKLKELEQNRTLYRKYLLTSLPSEPNINDEKVAKISFRLTDGRRLVRNFRGSETLNSVYAYIDTIDLKVEPSSSESSVPDYDPSEYNYGFILHSTFPRKEFPYEDGVLISSIESWWPSVNLVVETNDEE